MTEDGAAGFAAFALASTAGTLLSQDLPDVSISAVSELGPPSDAVAQTSRISTLLPTLWVPYLEMLLLEIPDTDILLSRTGMESPHGLLSALSVRIQPTDFSCRHTTVILVWNFCTCP